MLDTPFYFFISKMLDTPFYFLFQKKIYKRKTFIDLTGWAVSLKTEQSVGESNPCFRRERATS